MTIRTDVGSSGSSGSSGQASRSNHVHGGLNFTAVHTAPDIEITNALQNDYFSTGFTGWADKTLITIAFGIGRQTTSKER